jgi:hypothetical protein
MYFAFVFLVDIGQPPAATRLMSYSIRDQGTVGVGEPNVVLSVLLENLGCFSVGWLRAVAVSSKVRARCPILD